MMRLTPVLLLCACLLPVAGAAQDVIEDHERLAPDRPEAWAMQYVLAGSLMTAFGATPALAPGDWQVAFELGHIPRLSESQQRVGFGGEKAEDLNKSPVFGRARWQVGLPAAWVAEIGYTPPLQIDGARAHDLFALALGRRLLERDGWSLSTRLFGQHGRARGDITCPRDVAGPFDPVSNPFGCVAASDDRIDLNYYGVDLTAAIERRSWQWHATLALVRSEPEVQVDALVFTVRDRSRLVARDVLPTLTIGASHSFESRWSIAFELLHVPLDVRRATGSGLESDPFTGLRVQLRFAPD